MHNKRNLLRLTLIGGAGFILLTAALGIWQALNRPDFGADEAVFAEMGRILARGGLIYRDFWDHKPPVIYVVLASFIGLMGNTILAIKVSAVCIALAFAAVTAAFVQRITHSRTATTAAALCALLYGSVIAYRYGAETTILMSTLASAAYLLAFVGHGRLKWTLLSGVCFGLAFMSKQPILSELPILLAFAALNAPHRLQAMIGALLGVVVGVGAVVLWIAVQGIWPEFWDRAFLTNFTYVATTSGQWHFDRTASFTELLTGEFIRGTIPFLVPLLIFGAVSVFSLRRDEQGHKLRTLIVVWLALAVCGALIGRALKVQYFIQTLTPLIVMSALAVPAYLKLPPARQIALVLLAISLFGINGLRLLNVFSKVLPTASTSNEVISSYIEQHTSPDDCVWTWGFLNEVTFLADRRSCTSAANIHMLLAAEAFDIQRNRREYIADLMNSRPTYHIVETRWGYFPELQIIVDRYRGAELLNEDGVSVYAVDLSPRHETDVNFGGLFRMTGFDLYQSNIVCPGDELRVSMTWRIQQPTTHYFRLYLHLLSEDETTRLLVFDSEPAQNRRTDTWTQVDELIFSRTFTLPLPDDFAPGTYPLITGFYDAANFAPLDVLDEHGQVVAAYSRLAEITVRENC